MKGAIWGQQSTSGGTGHFERYVLHFCMVNGDAPSSGPGVPQSSMTPEPIYPESKLPVCCHLFTGSIF